jgi:asparagine synthase (glutamine-hydrolysing)
MHAAAPLQLPTRAASVTFHAATCGEVMWRKEIGERIAAHAGLEERHPLCDRRLIEFALSLPSDMLTRGGRAKWLLRHAFEDRLPPWTREVPASSDFNWILKSRLASMGGLSRLLASAPVQRGWVTAAGVRSLYEQMERGRVRNANTLWRTLAVDIWLRAVESAPASVELHHRALYDSAQP